MGHPFVRRLFAFVLIAFGEDQDFVVARVFSRARERQDMVDLRVGVIAN